MRGIQTSNGYCYDVTMARERDEDPLAPTLGGRDGSASTSSMPRLPDAVQRYPSPSRADELPTRSVFAGNLGSVTSAPHSQPDQPHLGIPRILKEWDRYEVQEVLGAGGMGVVYKARDPRLNRAVALKIIHPRLGQGPGSIGDTVLRRFLREARLQASLEHPHVCKVYEVGELPASQDLPGYPYIAMQLIAGQPLQQLQQEMSLSEKVRVIQQAAEALHAAHRAGLVHRDVKPSNIMVERTEQGTFHPYVMDFGLAQESTNVDHSRSGVIEGTPRYMAPEQARGEIRQLDRRTDVYALGVTLYELLSGQSPFQATNPLDILVAVLTQEPRPLRLIAPNVPPDLEAVALTCIEKEPAARYDSARALAADLGRYLDGEPVQARRVGGVQHLYRRARKHRLLVGLGAALVFSVLGLGSYGVSLRLATHKQQQLGQQQARLAERLGQEIKDLEWTLRSSRQLPLHNLDSEKKLIRQRMTELKQQQEVYGPLGKGLAHYALGRGHLALHEYPEALSELQRALSQGQDGAELRYALGIALGKQYEQALNELRMSGGSEWVNRKLRDLRPKYLAPAIAELQNSRRMSGSSPAYLDALLAFYQDHYDDALNHADAAKRVAPWLYEADKLAGDVHLEKAVRARDVGHYELAELEFAASVHCYQTAAKVGQSDAQVYEGLAESWLRQIEMNKNRGQPTENLYREALSASDSIIVAEPASVVGPLKRASAAMFTFSVSGVTAPRRVQECINFAEDAVKKDPGNPYAADALANCHLFAGRLAEEKGHSPEEHFLKGISSLEAILKQRPRFIWGINDLGILIGLLGEYQALHGMQSAGINLEKAIERFESASALDASYNYPLSNLLLFHSIRISLIDNEIEALQLLNRADKIFERCVQINPSNSPCYENYSLLYARAAQRSLAAGQDPRPRLSTSLANSGICRRLSDNLLDVEQHAALSHWVDAAWRIRHRQNPGPALHDLELALMRCFKLTSQDAMCRTLDAQGEWLLAQELAQQQKPTLAVLHRALDKALVATRSAEVYPDKWQVLAEAYLHLAQAESARPANVERYVTAGLVAVANVFPINPNHALGHTTEGALWLLRAQTTVAPGPRRMAAQRAVLALEQALHQDVLLKNDYMHLLQQAEKLLQP